MAVTADTFASGGGATTTSVSFSVTPASGATMFAGLSRNDTANPSSVTWNTSENLTSVGFAAHTGSKSWCYYLANPTSGTHTFQASWATNKNTGGGVWTFTGVDTGGTPYGSISTWNAASGNPSGIDVSAEIGAGDLSIGFCGAHGSGSITITKTAGTSTERFIQTNPGGAWMTFEGLTDTAGTPTWTISAGDTRTAYALAINASGAAATTAPPFWRDIQTDLLAMQTA